MDWIQFAVWFLSNIGFTLTLWMWNRTESNNDRRAMMAMVSAIHQEMKDFHGKLCAIEERSKYEMRL